MFRPWSRINGTDSTANDFSPLISEGRRRCARQRISDLRRSEAVLLLVAFLEKLSFFGLVTNLHFFLERWARMGHDSASAMSFAFFGVAYLCAVLGGFLADSKFGRFATYRTSLAVQTAGSALVWCASLLVSIHEAQRVVAIAGLVLVAVGLAGSSATAIPLGVDQYRLAGGGVKRASRFFHRFFWCATFGAGVAYTALSFVQIFVDFPYGLLPPVICYAVCVLLVHCQRHHILSSPPDGSPLSSVAGVLVEAFHRRRVITPQEQSTFSSGGRPLLNKATWLSKCKVSNGGSCPDMEVEHVCAFGRLSLVLLVLPFYMIVIHTVGARLMIR